MKKNLDELTKAEWDTFFPVELVPHNPAWKTIYKQEAQKILEKLSTQTVLRIEHFGSTAIPGIHANHISILSSKFQKNASLMRKLLVACTN